MRAADEDAFRDFATGRTPSLQRAAYLLTGDWQRADDLVSTALAKVYSAWGRLRDENVDAFARRALVTAQTSWWQRLRRSEPTVALPEADHEDERVIVRRALFALPLRQRAAVVFHHYDELDAEVVARILGVPPAFVRTQSARGLAALRAALGDPYSRTATTHYDDDRVLEALRGAVPPVPETAAPAPTVLRQRAGLLRTRALMQGIGAVASVLLVVGLAAAVARGGVGRDVARERDPLGALDRALAGERSVRFEAAMELIGEVADGLDEEGRMSADSLRAAFAARLSGAATADGDFQVEGHAPVYAGFLFGGTGDDVRLRIVDDDVYRAVLPYDHEVPPGVRWIVEDDAMSSDLGDVRPLLRRLAAAADDVKYVREVEARGTPAAEYRFTLPEQFGGGQQTRVEFAIDAQDRLRRVVVEFPLPDYFSGAGDDYGDHPDEEPAGEPGRLFPRLSRQRARALEVRITVELFGYGEDVGITAPPDAEVVRPEDLWDEELSDDDLSGCFEQADTEKELEQCAKAFGLDDEGPPMMTPMSPPPGRTCTTAPDGSTTCSAESSVSSGYGTASASPSPRPRPEISPSPRP